MKKFILFLLIIILSSGVAAADFGNDFLLITPSGYDLNDADDAVCINFTAHHTGHIWKVYMHVYEHGVSPESRYGFRESRTGSWLAWENKTSTTSEYVTVSLNQNLSVTEGDVLCFCIESTGTPSESDYIYIHTPSPRNAFLPIDGTPDVNFGVWWYDTTWVERTTDTPHYIVEYNDSVVEGQPYYECASFSVTGQTIRGQSFTKYDTSTIDAISVYAKRTATVPTSSLYIELRNGTNDNIITNVELVNNSTITPGYAKYTVDLPNIVLNDGYVYNLIFTSYLNTAGYYQIIGSRADETHSDYTYNGIESHFIYSTDNGTSWNSLNNRDLFFNITETGEDEEDEPETFVNPTFIATAGVIVLAAGAFIKATGGWFNRRRKRW